MAALPLHMRCLFAFASKASSCSFLLCLLSLLTTSPMLCITKSSSISNCLVRSSAEAFSSSIPPAMTRCHHRHDHRHRATPQGFLRIPAPSYDLTERKRHFQQQQEKPRSLRNPYTTSLFLVAHRASGSGTIIRRRRALPTPRRLTHHSSSLRSPRGIIDSTTTVWASALVPIPPLPEFSAETELSMVLSRFLPSINTLRLSLLKDSMYVLAAVALLSHFGLESERRTTFGKALSAPLATMALALLMSNLGLVPMSSPVYDVVNRVLVPLAVPLLLFESDLRRVLRDTGSLLLAFVVGAVSTIVGTLAAFAVIPLSSLPNGEGWKVASALAARHIGGAVNFVAVAETLGVSGSGVSAALAADNVVVALYFAWLFFLSKAGEESERGDDQAEVAAAEGGEGARNSSDAVDDGEALAEDLSTEGVVIPSASGDGVGEGTSPITLASLSTSLATATCLVCLGEVLTRCLLPAGTSSLPVVSLLTVFGATSFPTFFTRMGRTGTALGVLFVQMFFAASGAAGSIRTVLRDAPSLFAFSALQIAVHFVTLVGIGRYVFGLKDRELYLASNANVGGPTTAAAMARAKDWNRLILPALLVGIVGYASATVLGVALGTCVLRRFPGTILTTLAT